MPSFDVVSEFNPHEVANAVDQTNREILGRFDFKGSKASVSFDKNNLIKVESDTEFQLNQIQDILKQKLSKRGVALEHLQWQTPILQHNKALQDIQLQQGLDSDLAKQIVKCIKQQKLKVQPAITGDKIRVTGKKIDELQQVIALLREENFSLPLQFTNFRD